MTSCASPASNNRQRASRFDQTRCVRRASAASGPAPSYEGDDRTDQEHNSASDRENSNPLPDPALFPFIRRHVTSLMIFSTSLASLLSQNMPIVDLKYPLALRFSVSNPQQLFPLPQFPFEAYALGNLKRRDHASLDLLAALSGSLTRGAKFPARPVEMSREGVMLAGFKLCHSARLGGQQSGDLSLLKIL